jgi:hypothetical protein
METFQDTAYYLQASWAAPLVARLVIGVFGVGTPVAMLTYFIWSWRRYLVFAAHAQDEMEIASAPLRAGQTVVGGIVADDGAEGPAVTVTIEQVGKEWKYKGRWRHSWSETSRSVEVRPFHVLRRDGLKVRVEPDKNVFLVDRLDGMTEIAGSLRRRQATLTLGEPVYVTGGVMRPTPFEDEDDSPGMSGFVMRPPASGRMLISTEPLTDRQHAHARVHRNLAIATAIAFALCHVALLLHYDAIAVFGQPTVATVDNARQWKEWIRRKHGGYWVTHYAVDASSPEGALSDEVSYHAYSDFKRTLDLKVPQKVPFLVAGSLSQVGSEASCSSWLLLAVGAAVALYVLVCMLILASARPWYERSCVTDGGSGHLDAATIELK